MNETFNYSLRSSLQPFTNYTITVLACNSECSPPSESLNVRTKMGRPGKTLQPRIEKLNENLIIQWESPEKTVKNFSYFEMRINFTDKVENYRIFGDMTSCIILLSECSDEKIDVKLRTINIDPDIKWKFHWKDSDNCLSIVDKTDNENENKKYIGLWSPPMIYYCNTKPWYSFDAWLIAIIVLSFLIAYLAFRWYKCYQDMKNVHVSWPKGFDPDLFMAVSSSIMDKHEIFKEEIMRPDILNNSPHVMTLVDEGEYDDSDTDEGKRDDMNEYHIVHNLFNETNINSQKEVPLQPFIVNPITNEMSFLVPKELQHHSSQTFSNDTHVDGEGYMKMVNPSPMFPKIDPFNEGYLDMSGKSSFHVNCENLVEEEIEEFIRDSQLNNDGYVGKRSSGFLDSLRKNKEMNNRKNVIKNVNANGYVGLNIMK